MISGSARLASVTGQPVSLAQNARPDSATSSNRVSSAWFGSAASAPAEHRGVG